MGYRRKATVEEDRPQAERPVRRYVTRVWRRSPTLLVASVLFFCVLAVALVLSTRSSAELLCLRAMPDALPTCTLSWARGLRYHELAGVEPVTLLVSGTTGESWLGDSGSPLPSSVPPMMPDAAQRTTAEYLAFLEEVGGESPRDRFVVRWGATDYWAWPFAVGIVAFALLRARRAAEASRIELDLDALVVRVHTKIPFGPIGMIQRDCDWAHAAETTRYAHSTPSVALELTDGQGRRERLCLSRFRDAESAALGLTAALRAEHERRARRRRKRRRG